MKSPREINTAINKAFIKICLIDMALLAILFVLALPTFAEQLPGIDIEKYTNGADADSAPGTFILAGDNVNWTYEVTNTGNVDLLDIIVNDDQGIEVFCPYRILEPDSSMTCTASGVAASGQYAGTGTVSASSPVNQVSDSDMSYYFGVSPGISLEKSTNSMDADIEPGPFILPGEPITWTYEVTNTGNVDLLDITVYDDQGIEVFCPHKILEPGAFMTCTASGVAASGQYVNTGTVTASSPVNQVSDSDMSHYFGISPGISLEKSTNSMDADIEPGPFILAGEPITWTYEVTNTGNITLLNIRVTDDQGVEVNCPGNVLQTESSMICSASGTAVAGQYVNMGTATGTPPEGPDVFDTDLSHYFGMLPMISIVTLTNGGNYYIEMGFPVNWTYQITNDSNVTLDNIAVTDDQGVEVFCPDSLLGPGDYMICTASGTAVMGQYENIGTVNATDPNGGGVSSSDGSSYWGTFEEIDIEKSTNGQDADTVPGPFVPVDETIAWDYEVTNTGNVPLVNVTVTDNQGVEVFCPQNTLAAGESMTCTASGTATAGQYANTGTVTASGPLNEVSDSDLSRYFGVSPGDLNADGSVGILDAIYCLKIIGNFETASPVYTEADVDGDEKISLEELLYILQVVSELKP